MRGRSKEQFALRLTHRYRRTSLTERGGCCTNYRRIALLAEPHPAGEPDEAAEVVGGDTTVAGAATVVDTGMVWASSSWDAPQFRQNFAFGATGFPHSGQNGIIITTEWLNVVHKEHSISTGQQPDKKPDKIRNVW